MIQQKQISQIALLLIVISITLLFSYWYFRFQPLLWTAKYGEELGSTIEHSIYVSNNYRNDRDRHQLQGAVTGGALEVVLDGPDSSGLDRISLVLNVNADVIRVLRFSDSAARVLARVEIGEVNIQVAAREATSPCIGTAFKAEFLLRREEGKWKLSDVRSYESPVEVVHTNVCPNNWEEQLEDWLSGNYTNN